MVLKRTIASTVILIALTGCLGTKADPEGEILETQSFQTVMRSGKVLIDPEHGAETALWYGAIEGAEGTKANGVGFTHKFEDGVFINTTNVNIAKLDKGYYVAWLSKGGIDGVTRMGELKNLVGDVRHSVRYETKDDISAHTEVFITVETSLTPQKPGKVVAQGTLKKVQQ